MPPSSTNVYADECARLKIKANTVVNHLASSGTPSDVNLARNYCGTERGFAALLEWIKANPNLQHLDLSNNHLSTDNVTDLVVVLLKHPSIATLKLNGNRLFIESGVQLVRLARFNSNIVELDVVDDSSVLNANHIPERVMRKLRVQLMHNQLAVAKQAQA